MDTHRLIFFLSTNDSGDIARSYCRIVLLCQSSTFDEVHIILDSHLNDSKDLSGLEISLGYSPFSQFKKDCKNLQASFPNHSEMLKMLKHLLPTLSSSYL